MMGSQDEQEDAFLNAFDRREEARIHSELRLSRIRIAELAERRRVEEIIRRDRADRAAEAMREAARQQVENGEFQNIGETVLPPTPEQLARGSFRRFQPRLANGTVRSVSTYRREDLAQVKKLIRTGTIDVQGFRNCLWYRELHELTGLAGNIGSVDYGREIFVEPQSRAMFADHQVEAQDTFRFVRGQIQARCLQLLDLIVLEDVPIWRAARSIGIGYRKTRPVMARAVDELGAAREAAKADS